MVAELGHRHYRPLFTWKKRGYACLCLSFTYQPVIADLTIVDDNEKNPGPLFDEREKIRTNASELPHGHGSSAMRSILL